METFKEILLVGSTGHMPVELAKMMNASPLYMDFRSQARWAFETIPGFYVDPTAYGWLLTLSSEFDSTWQNVLFSSVAARDKCTEQLRELWNFASNNGCRRILLDADAAVIPGLPVFEQL